MVLPIRVSIMFLPDSQYESKLIQINSDLHCLKGRSSMKGVSWDNAKSKSELNGIVKIMNRVLHQSSQPFLDLMKL